MFRQKMINLIATLGLVALGVVLLIVKVRADHEPGAIPLLMILVGSAGYLLARRKQSSQD